jgi:hypothetical protein
MTSGRHEYFVYDGRDCIGRFTLDDKTGEAKAFGADRKPLGNFNGFKAAAAAIYKAARLNPIVPSSRAKKSAVAIHA